MNDALAIASGSLLLVLSIGIAVWADGGMSSRESYHRLCGLCLVGALSGSFVVGVASIRLMFF